MSKSKIKLRYLSCQSYEIIMPNGKHLLTDPAYGERWGKLEGYGTFTADQIKQCDYILLSHTHIDHIYGAYGLKSSLPDANAMESVTSTSPSLATFLTLFRMEKRSLRILSKVVCVISSSIREFFSVL